MGREDDRLLPADLLDERPDLDDLVRVEAARRLVEDEDVGIVQHRLREADALPEALRQLADQLAGDVAEAAAARRSP